MSLRRTAINQMSHQKRVKLAEIGVLYPTSTFTPKPRKATGKRARDTGPKQSVTDLVKKRSGGMCEWPGCPSEAIHRHHRLNRKIGGRFGEMHERINGAHWLLHACLIHHAYVTSPIGHRRETSKAMGWLLLEGQDAAQIPVHSRHDIDPVWLLPSGDWLTYEEAAA